MAVLWSADCAWAVVAASPLASTNAPGSTRRREGRISFIEENFLVKEGNQNQLRWGLLRISYNFSQLQGEPAFKKVDFQPQNVTFHSKNGRLYHL
jgi:hypothetical protein